jgi:hypothetical protein
MKVITYLRVAKYGGGPGRRSPYKVAATAKPSYVPLESGTGVPLPTLAFAVELDLPEDAFKGAEQVIATIKIPKNALKIAAEVKQ